MVEGQCFLRVHIEMQLVSVVCCVGDSVRVMRMCEVSQWGVAVGSRSSALAVPASLLGTYLSTMLPLAAALLFAAVAVSQTTVPQSQTTLGPPVPDPQACPPDKLTTYRVVLHTFWTREMFPKHYPEWRPPAQWSKLIGESIS